MTEFVLLLFLILVIILIPRNFFFKLSLAGIFLIIGTLGGKFNMNLLLPWVGVYSSVLLLEYWSQKLIVLEEDFLKNEYKNSQKSLAKSEMKLSEMDEFNRQLQLTVSKITEFFEMSKELTKVMYIQQLPPVLVNIVKESFDIKSLGLLILDETQKHGLFIYPEKNIVELKENIESPFIDSEKIISEEESGFYDGDSLEPLFLKLGYAVSKKRMYIIPLISEGKMNGFLILDDLKEDKTDLAHTLAGFLSLTLRKLKLYEKVQELAITDELTQVYVRRHFIKVYREELERIRNKKGESCFLMLDLDKFKECNDTFGHLVGDVVLRKTADIIKQNVREVDLVGRYGGEEFCVFLPDTKLEDGMYVGERIRSAVERYTFQAYDEILKITVSIGISSYPLDGQGHQELIEKADLALYYAKRKGRNRVISYNAIK